MLILPIAALTKPVHELNVSDIEELVTHKIREGESVEFKQALSSGEGSDPINEQAKRPIIKEVVALANGYGGRIFLGIAESGDEPHAADRITAILDCAEIARRFEQICGDLIEPPLLRLQVAGVRTGEGGSGVIVFDVPRSIQSPHRSESDKHCYRRRGSDSVPMNMREIQDMTLRSASRFSEIEAEFGARKLEFEQLVKEFEEHQSFGFCLRMSFVPLDVVDLGKVHGNNDVVPENKDLEACYKDQSDKEGFSIGYSLLQHRSQPILRGTKINYLSYSNDISPTIFRSDGVLNVSMIHGKNMDSEKLYPHWLVGLLANGLRNIERIRRYVGNPMLIYGLEVGVHVFDENARLVDFNYSFVHNHEFGVGPLKLHLGDHLFPRYEIGSVDEFDGLVNTFVTDWFNNAGFDWRDNEIAVDYQLPA